VRPAPRSGCHYETLAIERRASSMGSKNRKNTAGKSALRIYPWAGISDWLRNGRRRRNWRPFVDARTFVHGLKLKNAEEWHIYCRSGKKPIDIPKSPAVVYGNAGWININDWLGNGRWCGTWRSFEDARAFVHTLGLKNTFEWHAYCRSGKKPADIPVRPNGVYANADWVSWADWLGDDCLRRNWRSFEDARAFVHKLGLKNTKEWASYCKSGKRPADVPSAPGTIYANAGWTGMNDWLGTKDQRGRMRRQSGA